MSADEHRAPGDPRACTSPGSGDDRDAADVVGRAGDTVEPDARRTAADPPTADPATGNSTTSDPPSAEPAAEDAGAPDPDPWARLPEPLRNRLAEIAGTAVRAVHPGEAGAARWSGAVRRGGAQRGVPQRRRRVVDHEPAR